MGFLEALFDAFFDDFSYGKLFFVVWALWSFASSLLRRLKNATRAPETTHERDEAPGEYTDSDDDLDDDIFDDPWQEERPQSPVSAMPETDGFREWPSESPREWNQEVAAPAESSVDQATAEDTLDYLDYDDEGVVPAEWRGDEPLSGVLPAPIVAAAILAPPSTPMSPFPSPAVSATLSPPSALASEVRAAFVLSEVLNRPRAGAQNRGFR